MGLVGLIGCESQPDNPRVVEREDYTKPEGCYKVEDIRSAYKRGVQVLCRDEKDNLVLYEKNYSVGGGWDKVTVK